MNARQTAIGGRIERRAGHQLDPSVASVSAAPLKATYWPTLRKRYWRDIWWKENYFTPHLQHSYACNCRLECCSIALATCV